MSAVDELSKPLPPRVPRTRISAAWLGITLQGWSAMKRHAELAAKFASARFKHLPNALDETSATAHRPIFITSSCW